MKNGVFIKMRSMQRQEQNIENLIKVISKRGKYLIVTELTLEEETTKRKIRIGKYAQKFTNDLIIIILLRLVKFHFTVFCFSL